MKSVDIDGSRYQPGRRIVNDDVGGLTPEIGLSLCVDGDLIIGHGGWKIADDLIFRDGRHMA